MAKKLAVVEDLDLEDDLTEEDEVEEVKAKAKGTKKAAKPKEDKPKGIGAREIADRLGAEPKTFRAWLRRRVAAGDFVALGERTDKSRYNFGLTWTDPVILEIMEAWKADPHDRGAGLKKAAEAKAAKAAAAPAAEPKKKVLKKKA